MAVVRWPLKLHFSGLKECALPLERAEPRSGHPHMDSHSNEARVLGLLAPALHTAGVADWNHSRGKVHP